MAPDTSLNMLLNQRQVYFVLQIRCDVGLDRIDSLESYHSLIHGEYSITTKIKVINVNDRVPVLYFNIRGISLRKV